MIIKICVGSACHRRGSYKLIDRLTALIQQKGISEQVQVVPAFCLQHCGNGVTMQIDEQIVEGVSLANLDDIFEQQVLEALNA